MSAIKRFVVDFKFILTSPMIRSYWNIFVCPLHDIFNQLSSSPWFFVNFFSVAMFLCQTRFFYWFWPLTKLFELFSKLLKLRYFIVWFSWVGQLHLRSKTKRCFEDASHENGDGQKYEDRSNYFPQQLDKNCLQEEWSIVQLAQKCILEPFKGSRMERFSREIAKRPSHQWNKLFWLCPPSFQKSWLRFWKNKSRIS